MTLFIAGLALVIYFAEKLVKGVVGTSAGFGVSAFVISVVVMGFDGKPRRAVRPPLSRGRGC